MNLSIKNLLLACMLPVYAFSGQEITLHNASVYQLQNCHVMKPITGKIKENTWRADNEPYTINREFYVRYEDKTRASIVCDIARNDNTKPEAIIQIESNPKGDLVNLIPYDKDSSVHVSYRLESPTGFTDPDRSDQIILQGNY